MTDLRVKHADAVRLARVAPFDGLVGSRQLLYLVGMATLDTPLLLLQAADGRLLLFVQLVRFSQDLTQSLDLRRTKGISQMWFMDNMPNI